MDKSRYVFVTHCFTVLELAIDRYLKGIIAA